MNNSKSSGIGCLLLVALLIPAMLFKWLSDNPGGWVLVGIAVVLIIVAVRSRKKAKLDRIQETFLTNADKLDALAKTQEGPKNVTLALRKDERALFALYSAKLVEYASTGSTYSGTNLGVSVPLVGRVRGNIGGSEGTITKNPDVLAVVDTGTVTYTTQRIVFTGAKLVRDWDFAKVLSLDVGDNGTSVRIAVSGRDRTSGLQSDPFEFGAGLPAAYAYTWYQEGEEAARKQLRDTAKEMRDAVAELKEKIKNGVDLTSTPVSEPTNPVGEIDPNDPASSK